MSALIKGKLGGSADARFGVLRPAAPLSDSPAAENAADRVMVMLLALNFILLAFFAVINSTAIFETPRQVAVVEADAGGEAPTKAAGLSAIPMRDEMPDALRASIASVFAAVLPPGVSVRNRGQDRVDAGRADVDVPVSSLFADARPRPDLAPLMTGVAALLSPSTFGVRTEIVIRASSPDDAPQAAAVAARLMEHGVPADLLSVGVLRDDAAASGQGFVRFTFLVFDGESRAVARLAAARGGP